MAAFDYIALKADGKKHKGVIEADNDVAARQLLREQGYAPVKVKGAHQKTAAAAWFQPSLSGAALADFTRQFAVLLQAGIPIDEALTAQARQTHVRRLQRVALGLRADLLEGLSLSDAMARQPGTFNELYRAMVAAGEQSGALGEVLERLADHLDSSRELKSSIQLALVYPMVLTTVAITVIAVLMAYVVPKIVAQFDRSQQALPFITELMITISSFLQQHWQLMLIALLSLFILGRILLRQAAVAEWLDERCLQLPVIRQFVTTVSFARLARTLHILLSSGIELLDAMAVASQVVTNKGLARRLSVVATQVSEGQGLAVALQKLGHTPVMLQCMVDSGERSGELASMFGRAAGMMENNLKNRIRFALTVFEPILILVMGGIVLTIVMAILLPILELNNMTLL